MHTLLLNAFSIPVGILPWQRAVLLLLDGSVDLVESYPDRRVRSTSESVPWPAVVRDNARLLNLGLSPNRLNVLARDRHRCLYCGVEPRTPSGRPNVDRLTVDHVIPQCRAS
ncbi:HNH endonuclease, partial [bacterium]|nr:HNH endonuclease [bacterium]